MLLRDQVAVITGAGRGIGRAHALLLAREGARVVVNDLGVERDGSGTARHAADEVVAEIRAAGGQAVASHDSVTTREGVDQMMWTALNAFGRLDVLVNNAGILRDRTLIKMTEAEWDSVIEVHLRGTFLTTQAAARIMKLQGHGGRIVNTASVSGLLGNFGQGNYGAAKMGVVGLTLTAAKELLRRIASEYAAEDPDVLGEPEVWGVEALAASSVVIRLVVKTTPSEQWRVSRELRERIKVGFDAAGIEIPFPQQTVWARSPEQP